MGIEGFPKNDGAQAPQPVETEEKHRFTVGAKRNPDGTMDYSKAMTMDDPEGKMAQAAEEREQQRKQERAKRLEIPADVEPGTSEMVLRTLNNAIFINEEVAGKARKENKPTDRRKEELIEKLKMEQSMLDDPAIFQRLKRKILQEAESRGEKLTGDAVGEKMRGLSAVEMSDLIQEFFIDRFEGLKDEGKETAFMGAREYPIQDLLKAAHDLQGRLSDEAMHTNEQAQPKSEAGPRIEELNPDKLQFNFLLSRFGSDLGTIKGYATMASAFESLYGDTAKPTLEEWKNAAEKIGELMNEYRKDTRLRSDKAEEWLGKIKALSESLSRTDLNSPVEQATFSGDQSGQEAENAKNEQEIKEARLMLDILAQGGVGAHTSLPREYHPSHNSGFTDVTDPRLISGAPGQFSARDARESFGVGSYTNDLGRKYDQAHVREFISFIPVTADVYQEKEVLVQEKRMGGFLGSKSVMKKQRQKVGERPVLHGEAVTDGEKEPLVKLRYYVAGGKNDDVAQYQDYSGRGGNIISMEVLLPQSVAEKIQQEVKANPVFIRKIVKELMIKKLGISEKAWQEGDENTHGHPISPPYEKWDASGESMYIKESNDGYGEFKPERVIPVMPKKK